MLYLKYVIAVVCTCLLCLAAVLTPDKGWAATADIKLARKQTVYVPVYSNIISGPRKRPIQLEATLSVRNTDPSTSLKITTIDYYDTNGKRVRRYLKAPQLLGALASTHVHIEETDIRGGIGANFIVRWEADRMVNAPVIECIMIGVTGGQGISFVGTGQEIQDPAP